MLEYHKQKKYSDWEFVYDPQTDMMMAGGVANGGDVNGAGANNNPAGSNGSNGTNGPSVRTARAPSVSTMETPAAIPVRALGTSGTPDRGLGLRSERQPRSYDAESALSSKIERQVFALNGYFALMTSSAF